MRFWRGQAKRLKSKASDGVERVFLGGAYRQHRDEDIPRFTACIDSFFPTRIGQLQCFGADWMGRQFALDLKRVVSGEPMVALLDPATGDEFEIPCGYHQFHSTELIENANDAVCYDRFQEWLARGGQSPDYGKCIGLKTPLYLGGEDSFENFEVIDLEVYWHVHGQIFRKVRDLPAGTVIDRFRIRDS